MLFFSRTSVTILVVATETRGQVGAPFQIMAFPATMANELFQPKTATGKLKAVMMAITPSGFQHSRSACPGLSLGITFPFNILKAKQVVQIKMCAHNVYKISTEKS